MGVPVQPKMAPPFQRPKYRRLEQPRPTRRIPPEPRRESRLRPSRPPRAGIAAVHKKEPRLRPELFSTLRLLAFAFYCCIVLTVAPSTCVKPLIVLVGVPPAG
jgi:hypothetical protein